MADGREIINDHNATAWNCQTGETETVGVDDDEPGNEARAVRPIRRERDDRRQRATRETKASADAY